MKSVNIQIDDKLYSVLEVLSKYWNVSISEVVAPLLKEAATVSLQVIRESNRVSNKKADA